MLKIAAQLTPESYILSQKCHLTGGFALYTWFKDEVNKERALGQRRIPRRRFRGLAWRL